jgi:hypothetical protein
MRWLIYGAGGYPGELVPCRGDAMIMDGTLGGKVQVPS